MFVLNCDYPAGVGNILNKLDQFTDMPGKFLVRQ